MNFNINRIKEITIIKVNESKLYLEKSELFKQTLMEVISKGNHKLVVDLSKVTVINSTGLGALFLALYKVKDKGGDIKVVGLQPLVKEIFDRMKLNLIYSLFNSTDEAVKSF